MARNPGRPLSPHLTIWRWGPHMLVSILHRVTGSANAIGGGLIFIWWLTALAAGPQSYAAFYSYVVKADPAHAGADVVNIIARIVAIGLTWSFFQHMFSGLRHFVLDTGAGYELKTNKTGAILTMAGSIIVTLALWAWVFAR